MSIEKAREAVTNGAAFLDSHPKVPDHWRTLVDLDRLDITANHTCVLAQLAPHLIGIETVSEDNPYGSAFAHLFPGEPDDAATVETLIRGGFVDRNMPWIFLNRPDWRDIPTGQDLTTAWREALTQATAA